jgi:2-polyprenyl-6-methoxyphenol hydroxylase-like FAD-dependent oxidoreductase
VLNAATDTDILIVGAGPVGLLLANECVRRGLKYRLVESRSTQNQRRRVVATIDNEEGKAGFRSLSEKVP